MRLLLLLLFLVSPLAAQTLEVSGEVEKPLKLTAADLELLPHQTVETVEHSGEKAQFTGVPLHQILKAAGVPLGEQLRVILPKEKQHARWVRQAIKIEVRRAAKP